MWRIELTIARGRHRRRTISQAEGGVRERGDTSVGIFEPNPLTNIFNHLSGMGGRGVEMGAS